MCLQTIIVVCEYFSADDTYEYKEQDVQYLVQMKKIVSVVEKIKYENHYPVLLDATNLHRVIIETVM